MRTLADGLGVAPMALYRHVANKDDLVDAMIDAVFGEVELPADRRRLDDRHAAAGVLPARRIGRHRWAVGLMESRANPGPANLRHHDAMLGHPSSGRLRHRGWPGTPTRSWTATSTASR